MRGELQYTTRFAFEDRSPNCPIFVRSMRFDVLTLFPEMFPGYLGQSLLKRAIDAGLVQVELHNLRDFGLGKHRQVDDRPFGGGPGMVLMVQPIVECVEHVQTLDERPGELILFTPQGQRLDQPLVEELATFDRCILLCGRYEGFDERIHEILKPREVSIGDFILNGGEVASMVLIDSVIRLIPGVLGDEQSSQQDSFSQANRHLEAAQYTRPREFRGHSVPNVLLSGDHRAIEKWRAEQSLARTQERRADLLTKHQPRPSEAQPPEEV